CNGLARRASDPAASPGPKAADRAEEQGFSRATVTEDEDMFARLKIQLRFAQHDATFRRRDTEIVDADRRAVPIVQSDAARVQAEIIHGHKCFAKARHAQ